MMPLRLLLTALGAELLLLLAFRQLITTTQPLLPPLSEQHTPPPTEADDSTPSDGIAADEAASTPSDNTAIEAVVSAPSDRTVPHGHPRSSANSRSRHQMANVRDNLHTVSLIDFHTKTPKETTVWKISSPEEKDHVGILDGLALLLVFKPKSDVAAITQWRTGSEIRLLWAKNQPVTDAKELQYVEDLLQRAKDGTPSKDLLSFVIMMCKDKIFQRISKLTKLFNNQSEKESNFWEFNGNRPAHEAFQERMKDCVMFKNRTIIETLDWFTDSVKRITKSSEVKDFRSIIYFSWFVSYDIECDTNLAILLDEKRARALKKIGDYRRIIVRIRSILTTKIGAASLIAEQVLRPQLEQHKVVSDSLLQLTRRSRKRSPCYLEAKIIDNWDKVKASYEGASRGQPGKEHTRVNFTQHCEITLALEMARRLEGKDYHTNRIKIGVSKAPCQWCHKYLSMLTQSSTRIPPLIIIVRGTHGKQPSGWMLPRNGPREVTHQMAKKIEQRLDTIIDTVLCRRLPVPGITAEEWASVNEAAAKLIDSFHSQF